MTVKTDRFRTYVTQTGFGLEALAKQQSKRVDFAVLVVGDGELPDSENPANQTNLINQVRHYPVTIEQDPTNSGIWIARAEIPADDGDFFIREAGVKVVNENGALYSYARQPGDYKPVLEEGNAKSYTIRLKFIPGNASVIEAKIDPSVQFATPTDLSNAIKEHEEEDNPHHQYMISKDGVSLNDFKTVSIDKDYVKVAEVSGASHCAQVRLTITGTGVNFVANSVWEISLNHSNDLYVNEYHGGYSGLDLRIYYDNSHNLEIFVKHNGSDFESLLSKVNLTCWNVSTASIHQLEAKPKYPSYKDFNSSVGQWKTNRHLSAPNLQFIEYDPVRVYSLGEVCFTKDDQTGELFYWQWYSNVESLSGKNPLDPANRHMGWAAIDKPFYWIPYTGNQSGMPFYWLSDIAPEWAVMEINVDLPVAVYWRLARCYPHLVTDGTINTGEIRGEFLRVLDQGRGVDNGRLLNSFQNDEVQSHSHLQADLVKKGASGAGNGTALEAGEVNSGTKPTASYTYPTGGDETRPRNIARPMAIAI